MAIVEPRKGVGLAETKNGGVLLSVSTGEYFSLNSTAVLMWYALTNESTWDDCVRFLLDHIDATEEQLSKTVRSFASQLHDENLICWGTKGANTSNA